MSHLRAKEMDRSCCFSVIAHSHVKIAAVPVQSAVRGTASQLTLA